MGRARPGHSQVLSARHAARRPCKKTDPFRRAQDPTTARTTHLTSGSGRRRTGSQDGGHRAQVVSPRLSTSMASLQGRPRRRVSWRHTPHEETLRRAMRTARRLLVRARHRQRLATSYRSTAVEARNGAGDAPVRPNGAAISETMPADGFAHLVRDDHPISRPHADPQSAAPARVKARSSRHGMPPALWPATSVAAIAMWCSPTSPLSKPSSTWPLVGSMPEK